MGKQFLFRKTNATLRGVLSYDNNFVKIINIVITNTTETHIRFLKVKILYYSSLTVGYIRQFVFKLIPRLYNLV